MSEIYLIGTYVITSLRWRQVSANNLNSTFRTSLLSTGCLWPEGRLCWDGTGQMFSSESTSSAAAFPKLKVRTQFLFSFYWVTRWQKRMQNNADMWIYFPHWNRKRGNFFFCFSGSIKWIPAVSLSLASKTNARAAGALPSSACLARATKDLYDSRRLSYYRICPKGEQESTKTKSSHSHLN